MYGLAETMLSVSFCLIHTRTYGQLIELQVCMMGKVERHFPPLYEVLGTGGGGGDP